MPSPLILIGPMHAGKSTIAALLAERFSVSRVSMDDVRWEYYKEIGYSEAVQKEAYRLGGFAGLVRYWKPFEAHAVERLLADHTNERCVIDFGAGHSVYEDPKLFSRVEAAMEPFPVVLLLPSPIVEETIAVLRGRRDERHPAQAGQPADVNERFVRHPSNAKLAKVTIYTKSRLPEETVDDVAKAVDGIW